MSVGGWRDAWTTFSYALHSGWADRSSSLLRSFHCCSACTYTSSQGFWGLGKGLRDTYCELKNENERLAAKSLRERRQRNQVPCIGTSLQADYCNFNNIHSPRGLLNLQFKSGSDRADFLNVPFADVISFFVVLGGKGWDQLWFFLFLFSLYIRLKLAAKLEVLVFLHVTMEIKSRQLLWNQLLSSGNIKD